MVNRPPDTRDLLGGERARSRHLLDLEVFLGVDPGEWARGDQVTPDGPFEHLLGVNQDALGDAGPQGSVLLKKIEPLMQAYLLGRQLADHRKDMNLEAAQDVVVALFVLLAVGLVPLSE